MSFRLTPNAHRKNRLVMSTSGSRYWGSVSGTARPGFEAVVVLGRTCHGLSQRTVQMHIAPVHVDMLAGGVARPDRNQEERRVCDLFRRGHALTERNSRDDAV